ncbi:Potassium channel [Gryganskiella cystojenkinii]|nr:Potassium channel [Gryganskiella cystojenkinii]
MASIAPLEHDNKIDPLRPSSSSLFGAENNNTPLPNRNNHSDDDDDNYNSNTNNIRGSKSNNDTLNGPSRPTIYPILTEGHPIVEGSEFGTEEYELEKSDPIMSASITSRNRATLAPLPQQQKSLGPTLSHQFSSTASRYSKSNSRKALLESSDMSSSLSSSSSSFSSSTGSLTDPEPMTSLINPMETPLIPESIPHPRLSKVWPYLTITALEAYTVMTVVRCLADPTWIVLKSSRDKTGGGHQDPLTLKMGLIGRKEKIWLACAIAFSIVNCIGVTLRIMDRMRWLRRTMVLSSYMQAGFCIAAVVSFLETHTLPPGAQYSHGFLASVSAIVFSSVVAFMLSWDWWRGFPSAGLSATLKALIVSSFVITAVILVGAAIYTWLEEWTFDDSVNFCIVSFSTVGYGNISPKTVAGRVVFFFYGILGISSIGFFIVSLRNAIIEQFQWRLVDRFSGPAHMTRVQTRMSDKDLSYPMARFEEEQRVKKLIKRKMIARMLFVWIACWFGGAGVFCAFEKWTYIESLYFCFVTLTTIGFGDYVPTEPGSIEFWNVYVFIGLSVFAYILSLFSESMADHIHLVDDIDMDEEDDSGIYGWEQCEDHKGPLTNRGAVLGLEGTKWSENQQIPYREPPNNNDGSLPSVLQQPGAQPNQDQSQKPGVHLWSESAPPAPGSAVSSPGHPLADPQGNMAMGAPSRQDSMQQQQQPQQLRYRPRHKSSGRVLMVSAKERKQMLQAEYYAAHGGLPGSNSNISVGLSGDNQGQHNSQGAGGGGMMTGGGGPATIKFVDMYGMPHQRVVSTGRRMGLIPHGTIGPSGVRPGPTSDSNSFGAMVGSNDAHYGRDGEGQSQELVFETSGYFDDLARRRRGTVAPIHVPGMAARAEEARRQYQQEQQLRYHQQTHHQLEQQSTQVNQHHHHRRHQHPNKDHHTCDGSGGSVEQPPSEHGVTGSSGGMVGAHEPPQHQSTLPPLQTSVLLHQPQVKFESPRSSPRRTGSPRIASHADSPSLARISQESQEMAERKTNLSSSPLAAPYAGYIPPSLDKLNQQLQGSIAAFSSMNPEPTMSITGLGGRLKLPWPEDEVERPWQQQGSVVTSKTTPTSLVPSTRRAHPEPSLSKLLDDFATIKDGGAASSTTTTSTASEYSNSQHSRSSSVAAEGNLSVGPFDEVREEGSLPPFEEDADLNFATEDDPPLVISGIPSKQSTTTMQPPSTGTLIPMQPKQPTQQSPTRQSTVQQSTIPPPPPPPPPPLPHTSSSNLSQNLPPGSTSPPSPLPPRPGLTPFPLQLLQTSSALRLPSLTLTMSDPGSLDLDHDSTAPPAAIPSTSSLLSRSSSIDTANSIGPFDETRGQDMIPVFEDDVNLNHVDPNPKQVDQARSSRKELKRRQHAIEVSLKAKDDVGKKSKERHGGSSGASYDNPPQKGPN